MNTSEQTKIYKDLKHLVAMFADIINTQDKIYMIVTQIGENATALYPSDKPIILEALDATDVMVDDMTETAKMLDGYLSPTLVVTKAMYDDLSYNEFKKMYNNVQKIYRDYRNAYDFAYKVYDSYVHKGYYRAVKYYKGV